MQMSITTPAGKVHFRTKHNLDLVQKLERGEYPGLVWLKRPGGDVLVNLSENVPFHCEREPRRHVA